MNMTGFWKELKLPSFALAPMEDVTDTVFRELIASVSGKNKLQLLFTEFMSVDGFLHEKGHDQVVHRLRVSSEERELLDKKNIKLVAQIWGNDPGKFHETAKILARDYNFDGVDINMGCPVRKIVKNNACSALINLPSLAKEIIQATQEASDLPVSVKTRIGFNEVQTENWISALLEVKPAAITIHGRTQKMQSEGKADWNEVRKAVFLRDQMSSATRILGNGDVMSYEEGLSHVTQYGVDGIMIGRGIFHNPGFFSATEPGNQERIELLISHLERFREVWDSEKNYAILKRFFKIYIHSFEGAGQLRALMMETNSCDEGLKVLSEEVISSKTM